jgi:peptide/nickel transport system permease protein
VNKKRHNIYFYIIVAYALIGFFNAYIANSKAILTYSSNGLESPASHDFLTDLGIGSENTYRNDLPYTWAIYPMIHYHAKDIDISHSGFKSPGQCLPHSGHYLGTDQVGRDVAAGMVRGCYTSFRIGVFGTLLCGIIGIFLGIFMAYYGNDVKKNFVELMVSAISFLLAMFYCIYPLHNHYITFALVFILLSITFGNTYFLKKVATQNIALPFDRAMMGIIELRRSMPTLILVLVLFPLFSRPSINNVIIVIAILGWTNFARHARAESLSIKNRPYVTVSKMMGANFLHISWKHILPNIATTLMVIAAMNFASNILLESTLSFLGMGLPPDEVSWGSQLNVGRKNFFAWWMVVFPGLALFVLVYCVNKLNDVQKTQ